MWYSTTKLAKLEKVSASTIRRNIKANKYKKVIKNKLGHYLVFVPFSKEVEKVRLYAYEAHKEQFYDKDKGIPYSVHLDDVVFQLSTLTTSLDNESKMAAFLHDAIEDIESITREVLTGLFGERVATLVYYVTDEDGHNRKTRKLKTNAKLASVTQEYIQALSIKGSDRYSNMLNAFKKKKKPLLKMYYKEYPDFRNAVYREGHDVELWDKLDSLVEEIRLFLDK